MLKAFVILSVMLNVALAGGIGAYYFFYPDDAEFFVAYSRKSEDKRQIIREADKIFSVTPSLTKNEFEQLMVSDDIRKKYSELTSSESVQELLVESTRQTVANTNTILDHQNAATERLVMRRGDTRDFELSLTKDREKLRAEYEAFERTKKEWDELQLNTFLNQLVKDIDKTEDGYQKIAGQVTDLPTIQQAYVLRNLKSGFARTEIEAELPADQRAALKNFNARINANGVSNSASTETAGR